MEYLLTIHEQFRNLEEVILKVLTTYKGYPAPCNLRYELHCILILYDYLRKVVIHVEQAS
jgi:hypothetical protein